MTEKESMEQTKKWLAKEGNPREREKLKELADWHKQNYERFLLQPPEWIPWCVKQYLLGYRKERPSWSEIQKEYARRQVYARRNDSTRIKTALACATAAVLYILFKSGN